jgi:hypothetical protein
MTSPSNGLCLRLFWPTACAERSKMISKMNAFNLSALLKAAVPARGFSRFANVDEHFVQSN